MNGRFQHFSGQLVLVKQHFVAPGACAPQRSPCFIRLPSRREGAAQADPWRDSPEMYACAGKGRLPGEKSPECALRHANLARFHCNARKWRKITVVARIPVIFRHSRGRFPRKCAFREFFARQHPLAAGFRPARRYSFGNAATWAGAPARAADGLRLSRTGSLSPAFGTGRRCSCSAGVSR